MNEFMLNFAKGNAGIFQYVRRCKSQVPGVPDHVKERNRAGPALRRVHPVARPWIRPDIAFAAKPNVEAVEGVVADGNPNPEQLKKEDERHATQELDLFCVGAGAFGGKRVRDKVLDQKQPNRDDPGERMQASEKKGVSLTRA